MRSRSSIDETEARPATRLALSPPNPLTFPASSTASALGSGAVEHRLQLHPTAPQGEPARETVAFPIHVPAQPGQHHIEFLDAQLLVRAPITPKAKDLFVLRIDHFAGLACGRVRLTA